MNPKLFASGTLEILETNQSLQHTAFDGANLFERQALASYAGAAAHFLPYLSGMRPSPWSRSGARRLFDCVCVLLALPLLIPALLAIGLAVRLTSPGPVLFLQKRMGRHGQAFTILKFRTLIHATGKAHRAVTTAGNQRFTPVGPFLRRWKLDELPQLLNVLWGDMSLIGPRPKMLEHAVVDLPCRPGITGAATIAFAHEETVLSSVPSHCLDYYYNALILPTKRRIDANYMARATMLSDLKLIVDTVLRRWDKSLLEDLCSIIAAGSENRMPPFEVPLQATVFRHNPHFRTAGKDMPSLGERFLAFASAGRTAHEGQSAEAE